MEKGDTVQKPHGVGLSENLTTMDIPHKRIQHGGKVYFVGVFPEGDLAIHEWSPTYQKGYGGSLVTFLLDDGTTETVRGPFSCGDIFDQGRSGILKNGYGITGKPPACKITVGRNLWGHAVYGRKAEMMFQESALRCDSFMGRLREAVNRPLPVDYEVRVEYRNSARVLRKEEVAELLDKPELTTAANA
jgi:hypothetical protein